MRILKVTCALIVCAGIGHKASAAPFYFAGVDFGGNQSSDTLAVASLEEIDTSTDIVTGASNVFKKKGSATSSRSGASAEVSTLISMPDGQQLIRAERGIGADGILLLG